jgi:DNA-binding XRE family transcriptional regulator
MWMACYTQEEIAEKVGVSVGTVNERTKECSNLDKCPKLNKLLALYQDAEWQPPTMNVWSYAKKSNEVSHFGNSEQRIVDNLLYAFTEPFDIVVDPFAGGGSAVSFSYQYPTTTHVIL